MHTFLWILQLPLSQCARHLFCGLLAVRLFVWQIGPSVRFKVGWWWISMLHCLSVNLTDIKTVQFFVAVILRWVKARHCLFFCVVLLFFIVIIRGFLLLFVWKFFWPIVRFVLHTHFAVAAIPVTSAVLFHPHRWSESRIIFFFILCYSFLFCGLLGRAGAFLCCCCCCHSLLLLKESIFVGWMGVLDSVQSRSKHGEWVTVAFLLLYLSELVLCWSTYVRDGVRVCEWVYGCVPEPFRIPC